MAGNNSPQGWTEIFNFPDRIPEMEEAIALVKNSFPAGQYDTLTVHSVLRTMIPRKINGTYIFNLRLFLHDHDIAAFFFLRKLYGPVAYCVTPGALDNVTSGDLLDQLAAICNYVKSDSNAPGLDVVPEANPPQFAHQNMADAFAAAQTAPAKLAYRGVITPGGAWPARLYRWEITLP
jgi:hypothetical protein